jgi:hypothetical protein
MLQSNKGTNTYHSKFPGSINQNQSQEIIKNHFVDNSSKSHACIFDLYFGSDSIFIKKDNKVTCDESLDIDNSEGLHSSVMIISDPHVINPQKLSILLDEAYPNSTNILIDPHLVVSKSHKDFNSLVQIIIPIYDSDNVNQVLVESFDDIEHLSQVDINPDHTSNILNNVMNKFFKIGSHILITLM